MNLIKLALIASLLMVALPLTGCATAARSDAMVASTGIVIATTASAKILGNVAIGEVTGGSTTNPMWMSKVSSAEFEKALEASLRDAGLLNANRSAGSYRLLAALREVKQPMIGLDMTVTASVDYQLVDRATGVSIYSETISTPYTAKMSDAFLGTERLRLANEGSIRSNLKRLIQQLANLAP